MKRELVVWVATVCLWFGYSAHAQSYVKPVQGAPDYNGTYAGSPRTGSAWYTTLFRDNQNDGASSGCRGEGCGRHPGVDIAVPSGTTVVTPLSGTVVISRCDPSWGGLVVMRSPHPTRAGENVFQVFAHLRERIYADGRALEVGAFLPRGTVIGRSGGKAGTDACSGNSSGSHLHYQIDRDDGNAEPYYPSFGSLQFADTNFMVAQRTYNPMVFIQNGYRWSFNETGNREWWDLFNFENWNVQDGVLMLDGRSDPYVRRGSLTNCGGARSCSSFISAEASEYKHVELDWYNHCPTSVSKIYFITNSDSNWDEVKSISVVPPATGAYRSRIFVGWHPRWTGIITGIRIDASENCQTNMWDPTYFREIAITR